MRSGADGLVLEHLRALPAEMAKTADDIRTARSETTAIGQHMAGVIGLQSNGHGDNAAIKLRPERIERRLELTD